MDKIVVLCGVANHIIYATKVNNNGEVVDQRDICDVTKQAITAVRDYMVDEMNKNNQRGSCFMWKRGDGKVVKLLCVLEDGQDGISCTTD